MGTEDEERVQGGGSIPGKRAGEQRFPSWEHCMPER